MLFVFLGFEHVIVNMYYIPVGMLNGADVSSAKYIVQSLIPSFIGNLIGGCLLGLPMVCFYAPPHFTLPIFNKAQAAAEEERKDDTTVTVTTAGASPAGSVHTAV
ncbi:hypothetical protein CspeluHIS016_0500100 [Cutaneotrichosporon spelunceum]|uniref:Formate/nitrite transporter n=1 Tax=Cutaneotrichosporon spelunceum TaxID=1672016 RepID=A0AAD3TWF3_9TREE|nr:hypothetical protein CspeluHIS016_0500100 [Cutaneotrichosporon spelunceum]